MGFCVSITLSALLPTSPLVRILYDSHIIPLYEILTRPYMGIWQSHLSIQSTSQVPLVWAPNSESIKLL